MAKKRKSSKKKSNNNMLNITVVGTIILSVLLVVLVFTESGYIGSGLSKFLGGMMGWLKYIFPLGTLLLAINMACKKNKYLSTKLFQYSILLFFVAVVASIFEILNGRIDINKDISEIMKIAYNNGAVSSMGGGAIGTLAAVPLVKMLGKVGSVILSIGVAIILFVVTFGIDISNIINNLVEALIERKQEQAENRRQRREEYAKEEYIEVAPAKMKKKKAGTSVISSDLDIIDDEQIQINLNGRIIEEDSSKSGKYQHSKEDIIPLSMEKENKKPSINKEIEAVQPDYIENNLFKQEEQVKEDKTKQVLQLEHALVVEDENYEYPPLEILSIGEKKALKGGARALADIATKLQKTLYSFGVSAKVENVSVGPAITRYELKPAEGVRVNKIANLADDIALNLAAETIRIEAPIPGKQAVGIEVPNTEKEVVHLREVLESDEFQDNKSKLSVALGKDVGGKAVVADIAKMPHALIAGSTGSGKSVCINTIITSIIYNSKPSEVKLLMIDPKIVELSVYNGIPHLLIPVVTDPKKAAGALAWAVQEMENRYAEFASKGVRDLKGYNQAIEKENNGNEEQKAGKLPQIVIIIDELADLMMVASKDVEDAICRLAQKARAAGMHLVIATQRPSVDVITGIIKANVPSRIAFAVSSQIDSRTILDTVGAEKLLGKGDMLFYPSGTPKPTRVQGAFVSDSEVEKIVDFVKSNGEATYSQDIIETIENSNKTDKEIAEEKDNDDETDPLLMEAIDEVVQSGQASTSYIQRKFKVGYARAGRIIDQMEERGVISGYQGSKPRQVLMTLERLQELRMGPAPEEASEE
ncbi:MAG: DNA translocase FtsK [Clostridia bacterium]|nr:DNA translocase FtsK [Clostridia bacterium]